MKATHCPICMTPGVMREYETRDDLEITAEQLKGLYAWHLNCRDYWNRRNDNQQTLFQECLRALGEDVNAPTSTNLSELISKALDATDDRKGDKRKLKQENAELREAVTNRAVELDRLRKAYREKTGEASPI